MGGGVVDLDLDPTAVEGPHATDNLLGHHAQVHLGGRGRALDPALAQPGHRLGFRFDDGHVGVETLGFWQGGPGGEDGLDDGDGLQQVVGQMTAPGVAVIIGLIVHLVDSFRSPGACFAIPSAETRRSKGGINTEPSG